MELKAKLAKVISQVKQAGVTGQVQASQQATQPQGSVADELTKLASLKEQGILTQEEFDKKKRELLG